MTLALNLDSTCVPVVDHYDILDDSSGKFGFNMCLASMVDHYVILYENSGKFGFNMCHASVVVHYVILDDISVNLGSTCVDKCPK